MGPCRIQREKRGQQVQRRWAPRLLGGLLLLATLASAEGCGGYDDLSPKAYEYSMALYAIGNRQDAGRLDATAEQITRSAAAGEITPREQAWLQAIIDDAHSGRWESATGRSRRMMEDQVRR